MIVRMQAALVISTREDVNYSVTLSDLAGFVAKVNKEFNTPGAINEAQDAAVSVVKTEAGDTHLVVSMEAKQ